MYNQIGSVKNEINPKISLLCANLKEQFEKVDKKVEKIFK